MANTLITPTEIAEEALAVLYDTVVFPALVWRDFEDDFAGQQGDTITIRTPASFSGEKFDGSAITIEDATESSQTLQLSNFYNQSFAVTDKQLSMDVVSFSEQFLVGAVEAVAQTIEADLLALIANVAITAEVGVNGVTPSDPTLAVDAAKLLNDANVPKSERFAVIDTSAEAAFLKDSLFHSAEKRGDTMGLQEASIGRKFGFDFFSHSGISNGDGLFFHRHAIALALRVPSKPAGLASTQYGTATAHGMGLRVTMDYDINAKRDIVSIDVLGNCKVLSGARAVRLLG